MGRTGRDDQHRGGAGGRRGMAVPAVRVVPGDGATRGCGPPMPELRGGAERPGFRHHLAGHRETGRCVDYPRGLFALTLAIPALLLGLPAGWLADRRDRRKLLMASHVAVALALLLSATLVAADVSVRGLVRCDGGPGERRVGARGARAACPHSRARAQERILNANALNDVGHRSRGWGRDSPGGGVVVAGWGIEVAFVILAAMAAVGVLFLIPLRVPPREQAAQDDEAAAGPSTPTTMRGDIAEAFRFLWGTIELRMLFRVAPRCSARRTMARAGCSELADHLDISARRLGFLYLFPAGGILVSVLVLTSIPRVRNAGRWYGLMIIALEPSWRRRYGFPAGTTG